MTDIARVFVSSWFIKELPMRNTVTTEGLGSAFGVPRTGDSLSEICRALRIHERITRAM